MQKDWFSIALLYVLLIVGAVDFSLLAIQQLGDWAVVECLETTCETEESKEEIEEEEVKISSNVILYYFDSSCYTISLDFGHKSGKLYVPNVPSPPPEKG